MDISKEVLERFWAKVDKNPTDEQAIRHGCWLWTAGKFSNGYGAFKFKGKLIRASRFSLELKLGRGVGPGLLCLHSPCDRPECVNPNHLREGTQRDNLRDMKNRGRSPKQMGENAPTVILTDKKVMQIRQRRQAGEKLASIARDFGVGFSNISAICLRTTWKHVD